MNAAIKSKELLSMTVSKNILFSKNVPSDSTSSINKRFGQIKLLNKLLQLKWIYLDEVGYDYETEVFWTIFKAQAVDYKKQRNFY